MRMNPSRTTTVLAPDLPGRVEAATDPTLAAADNPGASRRLVDAAVMLAVTVLSLGLLLYVALGEARKTYPAFQIEKMQAQGALVQTSIEGFLRAGEHGQLVGSVGRQRRPPDAIAGNRQAIAV